MRSSVVRLSLAVALLCGGAQAALAQAPAAAPPVAPLVIKPVKPGLFMVVGNGGNVSVRVTPDGVILVDSKNAGQAIYDDLVGKIAGVSDKPVKWLIDTHYHFDHTGNNGRFLAAGAKVVAQKGLPGEFAKFTPPASNPDAKAPANPDVTYDTAYAVTLGGKTAKLMHYAPAHTGSDTIVYFPDLKVVATGDELNAINPNFDYNGGASIGGWINSLDQVLKLDWDLAIPGHGDTPMTREQVAAFKAKLATLLARAREQVKAGTPKDQLVAKLKLDDLWTFPANFWAGPGRLDGLYAEAGGK